MNFFFLPFTSEDMSTFDGVIKEYPLISIDNFLEKSKNYQSTVFFLSHCHSDHMNGLRDKKFLKLLESRDFSHIYMSDVSEHLLKNDDKFSPLSKYLVSLPIEQPTLIDVYDEYGDVCSRVVVTLLTAGHCPGSVMFLLEGENGRVLYTGDFRLPVGGSARLTNLHNENGRLKPLDSLYIDTTFCSEQCLYIPTREQCLKEILKLVEEWLSKGPDHIVRFICPAQYNYEFVFVEIFKNLGEKTHVFEEKLKKYKGIKIIEDAVTSIPTEARVHACVSGYSDDFKEILYACEAPCGYHTEDFKPIKVRLIKPSVMFFKHKNCTEVSTMDAGSKVHRVCFSTHSSLDEIRDMVKYLEPKRVYPNVVEKQTVDQILYLIGVSVWSPSDYVSPLGQLNNEPLDESAVSSTNSFPFYDDCYKIPQQHHLSEKSALVHGSPERLESTHLSSLQNDRITQSSFEVVEQLNIDEKSTALVSLNCDTSSPVKWECPILSSDDENFDPNSSFNSSKDKSDSEACATSQEQDSEVLENECFTPAKSKQSQSELSAGNHESSVKEHNLNHYSSGIRFELEKLLATQELNVSDNYKSKTVEIATISTNCEETLPKAQLSVYTSTNSELLQKPYTNPGIKINSNMNCNERHIPTNSEELLTKIDDLSKVSYPKQENSGELEVGLHILKSAQSSIDHRVPCNQNQATWRKSKLMIEVNKKVSASTCEVTIPLPQITPDKNRETTNKEVIVLKMVEQCTNKIINTNLCSNVTVKQSQLSQESTLNQQNNLNKSQSFGKLSRVSNNAHLARTVSEGNSITSPQASTSGFRRVIGRRKPSKKTKKRNSLTTKYSLCDNPSQCNFEIIGCPNRKNTLNDIDYAPCFSKKLPDPFASKYEKSLSKTRKKDSVTNSSDDDISILSFKNKCLKTIPMIDLSSDDCNSNVELFNCENLNSAQIVPLQNGSKDPHTRTSDLSEFEDDSPSLLMPTKKGKESENSLIPSCAHLGSGQKRKSADENTYNRKKSPKREVESDSHAVGDIDANIDSTPEDLLPFTHSQVSSYFKKIFG